MRSTALLAVIAIAVLVALHPTQASAYVGPGLGMSVVGTILALIAALLLLFVAVVWFPLKRALKSLRSGRKPAVDSAER